MRTLFLCGGSALLLTMALACQENRSAEPERAPSTPTPPPPIAVPERTPSAPTSTTLDELDSITEEDFEEDAIIDINRETLEEELDRLEAEIGD